MAGPLVVAVLAATISSSAGIVAAAIACMAGTLGFTWTPAVRARRPDQSHDRTGHRLLEALVPWGVRRVLLLGVAYGVAFGAAEVSMPAFAEAHGGRSLGGIALAAFSGGSLIGGILAGAASSSGGLNRRLQAISAAFALVLVLPLLAGSMPQMVVIMLIAGLPIAPSVAIAYNLIERAAVAGDTGRGVRVALDRRDVGHRRRHRGGRQPDRAHRRPCRPDARHLRRRGRLRHLLHPRLSVGEVPWHRPGARHLSPGTSLT